MHNRPAHSVVRVFGGLSLALALAGAGVMASPLDVAAAQNAPRSVLKNDGLSTFLRAAATWAPLFPPLAEELRSDISTGTDGRLTFLLVGNDSRGTGVQRTDALMIVSVKGSTMTAASFPRDTARIPNPFTANANDYFRGKINTILKQLKQTRTTEQALDDFEYVIEKLLGNIEIDFHVMITMEGFQNLFDQVDPIKVRVNSAIKDTKFWDNPYKQRGAYFPATASNTYELWAWQPGVNPALCDGLWRNHANPPSSTWCRRAIVFARSRKGSGNSDFKRAGRQQDIVFGAVQAVLGRGTGPLGGLANSAQSQVQQSHLHVSNDLPLTVGTAVDIYNRLSGANQGATVVFGPSTYSTHIPGTSSYQLKLAAVQSWAAANLK
jgi:LytR_cpsA_psr family